MKKIITNTMIIFCMLFASCITTFAKEKPHTMRLISYSTMYKNVLSATEDNGLPQARWWPGDPNPQPGSQEWLWTHAQMKPGSPTKAKKCAKQALIKGGFTGSAESAVVTWMLGNVFTLGAFAATFGVGFSVEYFNCIIS